LKLSGISKLELVDDLTASKSLSTSTITMPSAVDAIAIIGRDNNPLYFKTFAAHGTTRVGDDSSSNISIGEEKTTPTTTTTTFSDLMEPDPDLYLRLLVYSALDVVEERSRGLAEKNIYLGQLCSSDQRKVYSFVTTTSIKFIVVVTDEGNEGKGTVQDSTMTDFFRRVHGLFVDTMSNPFSLTTQSGTSSARDAKFIPSKNFERMIYKVVGSLDTSLKGT
jgi:hypothetical protein